MPSWKRIPCVPLTAEAAPESGSVVAVMEFGAAIAELPEAVGEAQDVSVAPEDDVELADAVSGVEMRDRDLARSVSAAALTATEIAGGQAVPGCGVVRGIERMYGAGETDGLAREGIWRIEAGFTVAEVIEGWAKPLGWTLSDAAGVEWRVSHDAWCRGSVLGAVSYLVDALAVAVPSPVVTVFAGNRVLLLEDDGSVRY